jgi:hypothetical protein
MKKSSGIIKSDKRVTLSFWQTLGHYSFMLVPLMFPAIELFYKLSGKTAINTFSNTANVLFIIASLIIGFFKWRELNYYELEVSRSDGEFENAVLATANKLNWRIDIFKKNEVVATGYNPWKSRDSQTIKIERKQNKVLINSMMELGFISVPDFFGINRQNRNTFLSYYYESNKIENLNEKVIQLLKEEEDRIENEPEWNFKNTLKRIVAYIFSLGFWAIGIAIWNHNKLIGPLLIFGIIGSSYVIFDIYVMWTKWKKASS